MIASGGRFDHCSTVDGIGMLRVNICHGMLVLIAIKRESLHIKRDFMSDSGELDSLPLRPTHERHRFRHPHYMGWLCSYRCSAVLCRRVAPFRLARSATSGGTFALREFPSC